MPSACEDLQYYVKFNKENYKELATNGKSRVIFWAWEDDDKGFEF